jgi:UDP-GlcNAc:undecaprenyl-phosphate GlcNAc-1-phosphate transferase
VTPIPLLGGVAIVGAVAPLLFFLALADRAWAFVATGLVIVTLLGLYKDRVQTPVSPVLQLVIQIVGAGSVVAGTASFAVFGVPGLDVALTILVVVCIMNAMNFLDVMDGLAGGVCTVIGLLFGALGWYLGDASVALVALTLSGATLGFLRYNLPPARIFLGDVGSFGLGLILSALMLKCARASEAPPALWNLALFLIPLFDLAYTTLRRVIEGRSPFLGGADHVSLRLLHAGRSTRRVLAYAYSATLMSGLVAICMRTISP